MTPARAAFPDITAPPEGTRPRDGRSSDEPSDERTGATPPTTWRRVKSDLEAPPTTMPGPSSGSASSAIRRGDKRGLERDEARGSRGGHVEVTVQSGLALCVRRSTNIARDLTKITLTAEEGGALRPGTRRGRGGRMQVQRDGSVCATYKDRREFGYCLRHAQGRRDATVYRRFRTV